MINHLSFWDCVQGDFNFSLGNLCEKYFSLSTTFFRVISVKDDSIQPLKKHHFIVVKDQAKQNIFINILKVISYCTIVLPIIMLLGKILIHNSHTFTNIAEFENDKAWETFSQEEKINLEKIFLRLSLDEWLKDPNASGLKEKAAKTIWECHLNDDDELDLSNCHLNSLPGRINYLKQLRSLNLGNNNFTTIPENVFILTNLTEINLSSNQLSVISESIGNLTQLIELHLDNNNLITIPSTIGNLVNLAWFSIHGNLITFLPAKLGDLINLKWLFLDNNHLSSIPAEIEKLIKLEYLYINHNQLTIIPIQIGNLTNLKCLHIDHNQLAIIPVQIGNLKGIENLQFEGNPHLDQLPPILGCLENITFLDIEGTGISIETRDAILESCENMRKNKGILRLPGELKNWFQMAQKDLTLELLSQIDKLNEPKKITLNEWLVRLKRSADYGSRAAELSGIVCEMLQTVAEDEDFKNSFFTQVEENNSHCGDRASMAFEELYVGWTILTKCKDKTIDEQLQLMKQTAKTITLRKLISKEISEYEKNNKTILNESVEIYLYFLLQAKTTKKVNLLTCMGNMKHSDMGKVEWIDEEKLFKEVNENYFEALVELSVFEKLLVDKRFKDKYRKLTDDLKVIKEKYDLESQEHDKKKPGQGESFDLRFDWETKFNIIGQKRKAENIQRIKQDLEKNQQFN